MQPKEQKVILLEDLPAQDEYEMAQPKVRTSSRRSSSKLSRGPLRRIEPQAIAGTAMTLMVARESRGPGQRGHDSYQKVDGPTDGEHPTDRTSSADIGGRENPIENAERDTSESHDVTMFRKSDEGGDNSESDDDDQLSVADGLCILRGSSSNGQR